MKQIQRRILAAVVALALSSALAGSAFRNEGVLHYPLYLTNFDGSELSVICVDLGERYGELRDLMIETAEILGTKALLLCSAVATAGQPLLALRDFQWVMDGATYNVQADHVLTTQGNFGRLRERTQTAFILGLRGAEPGAVITLYLGDDMVNLRLVTWPAD